MIESEIQAIRERAEAATEGPWTASGRYVEKRYQLYTHHMAVTPTLENSEFIAHARTDIPALLAHVAKLEKALEKCKAQRDAILEVDFGDDNLFEKGNYNAEIDAILKGNQ